MGKYCVIELARYVANGPFDILSQIEQQVHETDTCNISTFDGYSVIASVNITPSMYCSYHY